MYATKTPSLNNILLPIIRRALLTENKKVAPFLTCDDMNVAREKLATIKTILGDVEMDGKKVIFMVEEEDSIAFVVARFAEEGNACGIKNDYCGDCGLFHWDFPPSMSNAERIRTKKRTIVDYEKQRRKRKTTIANIPEKSASAT